MNRDWRNDAACRNDDPALFYNTDQYAIEAAQAICEHCPVRMDCLEFAVRNGLNDAGDGVWGGLTPADRALFRARSLA